MAARSTHTVVVHHWTPEADALRHSEPETYDATETVLAFGFECSMPFHLTVTEQSDNQIQVGPVPVECPLCSRPFSPIEVRRITNAAISEHYRIPGGVSDETAATGTHPATDVILDV